MMTGQKVVCVNGGFDDAVKAFYWHLPVEGSTYVIREVVLGVNREGELGEVCVYLAGLVNPCSDKEPYPARGFSAERFRPLEETEVARALVEGAVA